MDKRWFLAAILVLPILASSQNNGNNKVMVRWDIAVITDGAMSVGGTMPVHYSPPACTISETGTECRSYPPEILLTGSGTFQCDKNGKAEKAHDVTGGGTWKTIAKDDTEASGTYAVSGVISFGEAPAFGGGVIPPDNIGEEADARSGTAVLTVDYSDGSRGILVLEGPNSSALGYVSVTKDIDFYPAAHGFGCTDGYCLPEGYVLPIFHVTTKEGN